MRWKTKHRSECFPEVETKAKSQERFARLLLIAVIVILAVVSSMYVSLASADATHQIDLASGES
jgi:flagellar basal body-associated protein FliL